MFSTYVFNDCNDFDSIIDDVTAILTGTVDVLQLSAGCDTVNTQILTTYDASPWQLHDDGVPNSVVLKSSYSDSPSDMKYLKISLVLLNGNCLLDMIGFESWNATTHVGVNSTYHDSTHDNHRLVFGKIDAARFNGVLYLYANDKTCAIQTQQSDGSIGTTYSKATGLLAFSEYTRDLPWNVIGYPSVGLVSTGYLFNVNIGYHRKAISLIRVKDYKNSEYDRCCVAGSILNNKNPYHFLEMAHGVYGKVPDENGVFHIPLIHLSIGTLGYVNGGTAAEYYGHGIIMGSFVNSGFYLVPINTLTDFEIFTTDGTEYIAVRAFIDSSRTKRAMVVFKHG